MVFRCQDVFRFYFYLYWIHTVTIISIHQTFSMAYVRIDDQKWWEQYYIPCPRRELAWTFTRPFSTVPRRKVGTQSHALCTRQMVLGSVIWITHIRGGWSAKVYVAQDVLLRWQTKTSPSHEKECIRRCNIMSIHRVFSWKKNS